MTLFHWAVPGDTLTAFQPGPWGQHGGLHRGSCSSVIHSPFRPTSLSFLHDDKVMHLGPTQQGKAQCSTDDAAQGTEKEEGSGTVTEGSGAVGWLHGAQGAGHQCGNRRTKEMSLCCSLQRQSRCLGGRVPAPHRSSTPCSVTAGSEPTSHTRLTAPQAWRDSGWGTEGSVQLSPNTGITAVIITTQLTGGQRIPAAPSPGSD